MAAPTTVIPVGAIEHDGMLWKPRLGATVTVEEFIAARTLFIELNRDAMWNPWIRDERAADIGIHFTSGMRGWRYPVVRWGVLPPFTKPLMPQVGLSLTLPAEQPSSTGGSVGA